MVGSGFSADESRRALALTEGDVDNARAILIAEAEDAAEEEKAQANFERQQVCSFPLLGDVFLRHICLG